MIITTESYILKIRSAWCALRELFIIYYRSEAWQFHEFCICRWLPEVLNSDASSVLPLDDMPQRFIIIPNTDIILARMIARTLTTFHFCHSIEITKKNAMVYAC